MTTRRDFMRRSGALGAAGLAARLLPLAAASSIAQGAAAFDDYKALVCVFLYGGVDGNNLVVPLDAAGYAQYAGVRTPASGVNLPQGELLPIQPANAATPYGLHPDLSDIHPLFAQGRLAVLANVGPLNVPTTRANYYSDRPSNLFSHSDQQNQWQSSVSDGPSASGWGGRIADRLAGANGTFPVVTSIAGSSLFIAGGTAMPLALPATGGLALQASDARIAGVESANAADRDNAYDRAAGEIFSQGVALARVVNPVLSAPTSAVTPYFNGLSSGIAQQLQQVARLVEARAVTGAKRQVFFVSLGGFDTHANELNTLATLLGQLSPALRAFHDTMGALGVGERVTTFTLSDFGRTLQPASGGGTDHAWGNHHFILGGAVRGGRLFGTYPTLARAGPDDADTSGRWIPTTSVEQYGATLARWFGLAEPDLAAVFPRLSRFAPGDLGFLA